MNYETAKEIELAVAKWFGLRQNVIVPNVSWGFLPYEADMLVLTKAGCLYEVEIKISRSDLMRDKNKSHNHDSNKIRQLWFAVPEKLRMCVDEIPARAGLLCVNTAGLVRVARDAEVNGFARALTDEEKFKVARLSVFRMWSLKQKLMDWKRNAALAEAERGALTKAARLTCWACANDVQYVDGMHQHPQTGEWVNCKAIAINRELRAIEQLRDGEK